MKRAMGVVLISLILVFFPCSHQFYLKDVLAMDGSSQPTLTIEGDLIISGEKITYEDQRVDVKGSIIVNASGTLFLKNTTLNIIQTSPWQYNINFESSNLVAINSELTSTRLFLINFTTNSFANTSEFSTERGYLSFWDTSKAILAETTADFLRAYNSTVVNIEDSSLDALETRDFSVVSCSETTIDEAIFYDNSMGRLSGSTIFSTVRTYDSSRATIENSGKRWQLETHEFSSALISKSELEALTIYDYSLVSIWDTKIREGLTTYGSSNVFIFYSEIETPVELKQYLATYESSRVFMFSVRIKGLLSAHDSSSITAEDSTIGWLNARESSKLELSASTIPALYTHGSSSATISDNCTITILSAYDSSQIIISDSRTSVSNLYDSSDVFISTSEINQLFIYGKSVKGSFSSLRPGMYERWNSITNSSITTGSGGYAPNVTLSDTEILDGWNLIFSGSTNVDIIDSAIGYVSGYDTATLRLVNTTASFYDVADDAKIYFYWYLEVQALSNATVTVSYWNGTVLKSQTADNGIARFTIMEKMIDSLGIFEMDEYTVDATSPDYSEIQTVKIAGNTEIILSPPIPWWQQYWYLIVTLSVAVALIAGVFLMLKKRRSM